MVTAYVCAIFDGFDGDNFVWSFDNPSSIGATEDVVRDARLTFDNQWK